MILSKKRITEALISLRLCCLQMLKTDFLTSRPIYVTRHDILCPNAVKRDFRKMRYKSDVIYATALCCANCTSLSVICKYCLKPKMREHFTISSQRKYLIMDYKIYTYDHLNHGVGGITDEITNFKHVSNKKIHRLSDTFCVGSSAFLFLFYCAY